MHNHGFVAGRTVWNAAARNQSAARRILVAEDDREMGELLVAALHLDGYEVVQARTGAQLLESIGTHLLNAVDSAPVDLIISDIRLPGMSGLEVLAALRQTDWSTPVILISAFADPETHAEAHRLGAKLVFNKPFEMDDLRMAVEWLTDRAPAPRSTAEQSR
jgi:DNA-binding response OmpR family regulator